MLGPPLARRAASPRSRSALRWLLAGALLPCCAAAAEEPPVAEPPVAEETFYEAIQVRVAEVEVVVTDRQGNRVTGLTRDDFTLYEDGQRVELTAFAAYAPAAPAAAPTAEAAATAEPPATPPVVAKVVERPEATVVAVLLDNQSLTLAGRRRLLDHVETLISELAPSQEIAIAAQDSPGALRILLRPTSDRAAARAALDRAASVVPQGNHTMMQMQRLTRVLEAAPNPEDNAGTDLGTLDAEAIYADIVAFGRELEAQAHHTAAALEQLVEAVAGLPGRKGVVLVSGGIPHRPAEALVSAWRNRFGRFKQLQHVTAFRDDMGGDVAVVLARTAAHANAGRVAIYALASPAVLGTLSAEMRGAEVWTSLEASTATMNARDSMLQLALPTGGVAGFDNGGKQVVAALQADLQSYYSLGYTPKERRRGKDHPLRVEVSRPGLVVRHRAVHRDRTSSETMTEHTRAALLFGRQENALGIAVHVAPAEPGKQRGTTELPLMITLPLSQVVLVPQGEAHEGRLTIFLGATDEDGRQSPVSSIEVPVRVPNDQLLTAMSQTLAYRTRLAVRTKRQQIAVTVRDELAHRAGTVLVEHPPEDAAPASRGAEPPASEQGPTSGQAPGGSSG